MARKTKQVRVIVDRMVSVTPKDGPKINYPRGWTGEVSSDAWKQMQAMKAARKIDGSSAAPEPEEDEESANAEGETHTAE